MELSRRVALDGKQLDEVDDRIIIQSIEPAAAKYQINTTAAACGFGSRITGTRRDSMDIVVKFSINEKSYKPEKREKVLDKVKKWAANGGIMTVNYKPGQRISVILAQAPGEGDIKNRGNQYALTFRAYGIPYWEQDPAESAVQTAANTNKLIKIDGSAETQIDVTLKNISGQTINTATVQISKSGASRTIQLTNLGLAGNEALVIDHKDGLIRIRILGANGTSYRSAMANRTSGSDDDLKLAPGNWNARYTADRACEMTVSWRARYL